VVFLLLTEEKSFMLFLEAEVLLLFELVVGVCLERGFVLAEVDGGIFWMVVVNTSWCNFSSLLGWFITTF